MYRPTMSQRFSRVASRPGRSALVIVRASPPTLREERSGRCRINPIRAISSTKSQEPSSGSRTRCHLFRRRALPPSSGAVLINLKAYCRRPSLAVNRYGWVHRSATWACESMTIWHRGHTGEVSNWRYFCLLHPFPYLSQVCCMQAR